MTRSTAHPGLTCSNHSNRLEFVMIAAMAALPFLGLFSADAADSLRQNERLGRGVNIIGWDELWPNPERGQFKDRHFKLIHEAGFSHVRINLHPLRDGKPDAQGNLRQEFFTTLDWAIDEALANRLLALSHPATGRQNVSTPAHIQC